MGLFSLHSSNGSNRRRMIKMGILVCLAALAAAEADADEFYGPYGYGDSQGYSFNMNMDNMNMDNMNMENMNMNYMNMDNMNMNNMNMNNMNRNSGRRGYW